ncbi:MAG: N-acetylglucosamine-6-phosphate deacetylase [Planctomycetota bacterium]|nr:N-acetylglucosamine-6-phosphate deacetylase [Planctomycetota bacterium]
MDFIDIQVNGYAAVDFLGELVTPEQFRHVVAKLKAGRVRAILPTITTNDTQGMAARLANLRKLIDQDPADRKLMPAFHIEGPCISPEDGYRGAHPLEWVRPADPELFKPLVEACGGWDRLAMVTLAPEVDRDFRTTRWLVEHGVTVAMGHTNASLQQLREAEAAGVTLFTHFGNGCHHLVDRHDNVLNRALSLEKIKYSLIPDGHHLPYFLLKAWLRLIGLERCVFTTDCVSPADAPPGRYKVMHWDLEVGPSGRVQPAGKNHLAGSALTMRQGYANAIEHLGLTPAEAKYLTHDHAAKLFARFLG